MGSVPRVYYEIVPVQCCLARFLSLDNEWPALSVCVGTEMIDCPGRLCLLLLGNRGRGACVLKNIGKLVAPVVQWKRKQNRSFFVRALRLAFLFSWPVWIMLSKCHSLYSNGQTTSRHQESLREAPFSKISFSTALCGRSLWKAKRKH